MTTDEGRLLQAEDNSLLVHHVGQCATTGMNLDFTLHSSPDLVWKHRNADKTISGAKRRHSIYAPPVWFPNTEHAIAHRFETAYVPANLALWQGYCACFKIISSLFTSPFTFCWKSYISLLLPPFLVGNILVVRCETFRREALVVKNQS